MKRCCFYKFFVHEDVIKSYKDTDNSREAKFIHNELVSQDKSFTVLVFYSDGSVYSCVFLKEDNFN